MTVLATLPLASLHTSTLLAAVKDASKATPKRPAVPVLTGLRLHQLSNGMLEVSGFDYETSITRRVPMDGELPDVLVPGAILRTALQNLNVKESVTLAVDGGKFVVTQGRKRVSLDPLNLAEYPDLPKVPKTRQFTVSGDDLAFIGTKVAMFVGRDDYLPVLTTVNFAVTTHGPNAGMLVAGATDRYRAALAEFPVRISAKYEQDVSALVPNAPLIGSLFNGVKNVAVTLDNTDTYDGIAYFHSDETTVTTRLIGGEHPRLASLFPAETATVAVLDPTQTLAAIKFAQTGCERNTPVHLHVDGDTVSVSGVSGEEKFTDAVDAAIAGPEVTIGFNPTYLADAFKVWGKGHAVSVGINQPTRPAVFTSPAAEHLRVLVMPVRLNG